MHSHNNGDDDSELLKVTRDYYASMDDKDSPPPSAKAIDEGYNQTYLIMANENKKKGEESKNGEDNHEVFFRCGNWCYKGEIQFAGVALNTEEVPLLIPMLQKQQGSLRYYCNAKSVPPTSSYAEPLRFLVDAIEFIGQEILSDSVDKELRKMASVFPWIDDDSASTYFELALGNVPSYMDKVSMIASKTYTRGLVIISIYSEGVIYFLMQPGEGDQALLDVRFPDVSQHGQGLHIDTYNDHTVPYRKLTLWHILGGGSTKTKLPKEMPKIKTINVSNSNYEQTYCILKSSWDDNSPTLTVHHDVLFRFGSWCYSGRVQLTPSLSLADIPYVIPALRMQQSRLDYLCDVNQVPTTSPFAAALSYVRNITPLVEKLVVESESTLDELIERLTGMGLGESVTKWLEGDPGNSFFEFKLQPDAELSEKFKNVEMIVTKTYYASGIITITIIFQFTVYVALLENVGESPLLDSRFPDVSGKGRGYQLQAFASPMGGEEIGWPELRKVSIWQTVSALEQEFREKAEALAQSKDKNNNNTSATNSSGMSAAAADSADGNGNSSTTSNSNSRNCISNNQEEENDVEAAGVSGSVKLSGYSNNDNPETEVPAASSSSSSMMRADDKSGSPARVAATAAGAASALAAADSKSPSGTAAAATASPPQRVALPHHVPKMESLGSKLDDIRKNMGEQGLKAPWDGKGKPVLGSIGGGGGGGGGMGLGRGLGGSLAPLGAIGKDSKK